MAVGNRIRVIHQVDSGEVDGGDAGAGTVTGVHNVIAGQGLSDRLVESGVGHCPSEREGIAAYDPKKVEREQPAAQTVEVVEVFAEVEPFALKAERSEVIDLTRKDSQPILPVHIERIEDRPDLTMFTGQFAKRFGMRAETVRTQVKLHVGHL